jgi:N-methylhydantoinase A
VFFSPAEGWQQARVYQRSDLLWGNQIQGPALVEEYASTTIIFSGDQLTVDPFGNLIIEVNHDND